MVFVTETWLSGAFSDTMINLDDQFQIFRCDRISRRGGGVCALVSNELKCVRLNLSDRNRSLLDQSQCELIHFDIYFSDTKYRIVLVYRPPSSTLENSKLPNATKSIIDLMYNIAHPTSTTVILGDFNLPFIDWHSYSARNDGVSSCFLDCFLNLGLHQFVLEPTRYTQVGAGNILDIVLCNDQSAIDIECINSPLSTSDHCIVDFVLHFPQSTFP